MITAGQSFFFLLNSLLTKAHRMPNDAKIDPILCKYMLLYQFYAEILDREFPSVQEFHGKLSEHILSDVN